MTRNGLSVKAVRSLDWSQIAYNRRPRVGEISALYDLACSDSPANRVYVFGPLMFKLGYWRACNAEKARRKAAKA